jgi:hypothetical protein
LKSCGKKRLNEKIIKREECYHLCKIGLISCDFWMYIRLFQSQIHRRDAEDARGESISGESVRGRFSRSSWRAAINMPERMRTFDLVASHHQIENNYLSAISAALR